MLKVKDENTNLKYDETFNIIEYAEGSTHHNCIFKNANDIITTEKKKDSFQNVF